MNRLSKKPATQTIDKVIYGTIKSSTLIRVQSEGIMGASLGGVIGGIVGGTISYFIGEKYGN